MEGPPTATAIGSNAIKIIIEYPFPSEFRCPTCYIPTGRRGGGVYVGRGDLVKHARIHHPGSIIEYRCGVCGFVGTGRYPVKSVKSHHAATHEQPGSPRGSRASTALPSNDSTDASGRGGPEIEPAGSRAAASAAATTTTTTTTTTTATTTRPQSAGPATIRRFFTAAAAATSSGATTTSSPATTTMTTKTTTRKTAAAKRAPVGARASEKRTVSVAATVMTTSSRSSPAGTPTMTLRFSPVPSTSITPTNRETPPTAASGGLSRRAGATAPRTSPAARAPAQRNSSGSSIASTTAPTRPVRRAALVSRGSSGTPPTTSPPTTTGGRVLRSMRGASVPVEVGRKTSTTASTRKTAVRRPGAGRTSSRVKGGSPTAQTPSPRAVEARKSPPSGPPTSRAAPRKPSTIRTAASPSYAAVTAGAPTIPSPVLPSDRSVGLQRGARASTVPPGYCTRCSPPTRERRRSPRTPPQTISGGTGAISPVTSASPATLSTTTVTTTCGGGSIMTPLPLAAGGAAAMPRLISAAPLLPIVEEVVAVQPEGAVRMESDSIIFSDSSPVPWQAVEGRHRRGHRRISSSGSSSGEEAPLPPKRTPPPRPSRDSTSSLVVRPPSSSDSSNNNSKNNSNNNSVPGPGHRGQPPRERTSTTISRVRLPGASAEMSRKTPGTGAIQGGFLNTNRGGNTRGQGAPAHGATVRGTSAPAERATVPARSRRLTAAPRRAGPPESRRTAPSGRIPAGGRASRPLAGEARSTDRDLLIGMAQTADSLERLEEVAMEIATYLQSFREEGMQVRSGGGGRPGNRRRAEGSEDGRAMRGWYPCW